MLPIGKSGPHYIIEDYAEEVLYPDETFHIQDGNALFYNLKDIPPTFGGIRLKILDQMDLNKRFIFSTDSHNSDSIESQERLRRGVFQKFIIDGPST